MASWAHRKLPRRLTASTASKSAAVSWSEGLEIWMPASSARRRPGSRDVRRCHRPWPRHRPRSTGRPYEHIAHAVLLCTADACLDLLVGVVGLLRPSQVVESRRGAVLREAQGDDLPDPPTCRPATSTFLPVSARFGPPRCGWTVGSRARRVQRFGSSGPVPDLVVTKSSSCVLPSGGGCWDGGRRHCPSACAIAQAALTSPMWLNACG